MELSKNFILTCAKEFTSLALENELIAKSESSEATAEEVAAFFKTLVNSISQI